MSMILDLLVKLKYESSTIILLIGIRYSVRDLLSGLNNHAWPATDEKCSLNSGFEYDLMMIRDCGLLFGPPCRSFNNSTHNRLPPAPLKLRLYGALQICLLLLLL